MPTGQQVLGPLIADILRRPECGPDCGRITSYRRRPLGMQPPPLVPRLHEQNSTVSLERINYIRETNRSFDSWVLT